METMNKWIVMMMVTIISLFSVSCSSDDDEEGLTSGTTSGIQGYWQETYNWPVDEITGAVTGSGWDVSGFNSDYVCFNPDGTFTYGWQEKEVYTYSGTYKYDSSKGTIVLSLFGTAYERWDIHKLDSKTLQVTIYDLEEGEYYYRYDFTRISKFPWE